MINDQSGANQQPNGLAVRPDELQKKLEESPAFRTLPPQQREQAIREVQATLSFTSPFPPPELLAQYEHLHQGAVATVIEMAKKDQDHAQAMERIAAEEHIRVGRRNFICTLAGMVAALIACIGFLAAATAFALSGSPWPGTILGGGTLVAVVSAFIYGNVPSGSPATGSEPPPKRQQVRKRKR